MGRITKDSIQQKVSLPKPVSAFAPENVWSNKDMEPIPREEWTWGIGTFAAYWFSDLINAGSWSQVSSFVVLGLTWWESTLAVFVGGLLISFVIALNGIIGARLHTPFAITSRGSFGVYGSYFPVVSRMVIAWFWFSVNTYQGGIGIQLALTAIWPSFRNFKNHLPASSGTTSKAMLCFFIFWLLQFPLCLIHPRKLKPLFILKAVSVPMAAVGMMIWSIVEAGPQRSEVMRASSQLSGSAYFYAFMTAVTSCTSIWSTMSLSIGDWSRYCKKETAAWMQIVFVPALFTVCALFGAICSNMTLAIYGQVLFQPFDIIDLWLRPGTGAGRFAAFMASMSWAIGNMGTNITANSISSANDLAVLAPRYVNILRGQMVAVIVGVWAFAPWKVLASAQSFIAFISSYSVILLPFCAVMITDYYIIHRRGGYDVVALYDPHGIYRYTWGINWRAIIAVFCGAGPCLPGMAKSLDSSVEIGGAKWIYCVANIFGVIVTSGVYFVLNKVLPNHTTMIAREVLAHDVLEGRVPEYAHLAAMASAGDKPAATSPSTSSERVSDVEKGEL